MPPSIQGALKVCRGLHIPFLWVDSLCMVQDDIQAWLHGSTEMDRIYLNSHLTIADLEPATCKSHFLGLQSFGDGKWQQHVKTGVPTHKDGPEIELFVRLSYPTPTPNKQHSLDKRAWCMQESLPPNRRLCFNGDEMVWECLCRHLCECGHTIETKNPSPYADRGIGFKLRRLKAKPHVPFSKRIQNFADTDPPLPRGDIESTWSAASGSIGAMRTRWRRLIADYSHQNLSQEVDKLRAVAGLAKMLADRFRHEPPDSLNDTPKGHDEYLAGLWKNGLHLDLLWTVTDVPNQVSGEHGNAVPGWIIPTWSWASTAGRVDYECEHFVTPWKRTPRATNVCRIEGINLERELEEDETSAIIRGSVTL